MFDAPYIIFNQIKMLLNHPENITNVLLDPKYTRNHMYCMPILLLGMR